MLSGTDALSVAVVAAHPDDESVGLGRHLRSLRGAAFLFATDGAPRSMGDAHAAGLRSRDKYARVREAERRAAFRLAGIPERVERLGMVDQEAIVDLVSLTRRTAAFLRSVSADVVVTHPYEGGHPDHDACAFAVCHACAELQREGRRPPQVLEMACYHGRDGRMTAGEFLTATEFVEMRLSPDDCAFKRALFDCYRSQHRVLQHIPVGTERLRQAPSYAFSSPPHDGRLLYEMFGFDVTGAMWRNAARDAESELTAARSAATAGDR